MPAPVSELPLFALTANAMKRDREKYLAAWMNACVPTPIDLSALTDALTEVTGLSARSASEPSRQPKYAAPT